MAENLETNAGSVDATETARTYTEEEVQELLQKEADRRVTSALKKQEQKNAEKLREAQKVANMDAAQKYQYELEQREAAIAAKERELALMENKNACSKILADKGLSLELVDFIVADDAETMNANIKTLERAFKNSVKLEVEKRLGSAVPKKDLPRDTVLTKDQFRKMSLSEKQQLADNNPEIYNELKLH